MPLIRQKQVSRPTWCSVLANFNWLCTSSTTSMAQSTAKAQRKSLQSKVISTASSSLGMKKQCKMGNVIGQIKSSTFTYTTAVTKKTPARKWRDFSRPFSSARVLVAWRKPACKSRIATGYMITPMNQWLISNFANGSVDTKGLELPVEGQSMGGREYGMASLAAPGASKAVKQTEPMSHRWSFHRSSPSRSLLEAAALEATSAKQLLRPMYFHKGDSFSVMAPRGWSTKISAKSRA